MTNLHSTSKTRVELGGMSGGAPWAPYAMLGGRVRRRFPPTFSPATPTSQPCNKQRV